MRADFASRAGPCATHPGRERGLARRFCRLRVRIRRPAFGLAVEVAGDRRSKTTRSAIRPAACGAESQPSLSNDRFNRRRDLHAIRERLLVARVVVAASPERCRWLTEVNR